MAVQVFGGPKTCSYGCVGFGDCLRECPFDAISVVDGVAVVDYARCRGCGVCVASCPKGIIELIPFDSRHWVGCKSIAEGAMTRKVCDTGCIGCGICAKNCPEGAITVENHVAKIDYSKCTACDTCVTKCPRNIIWQASKVGDAIVITKPDGSGK